MHLRKVAIFLSEEPLDTSENTHEARDLTYNELGVGFLREVGE